MTKCGSSIQSLNYKIEFENSCLWKVLYNGKEKRCQAFSHTNQTTRAPLFRFVVPS